MSYLPLCLVCLAIMTAFIIAEHAERWRKMVDDAWGTFRAEDSDWAADRFDARRGDGSADGIGDARESFHDKIAWAERAAAAYNAGVRASRRR